MPPAVASGAAQGFLGAAATRATSTAATRIQSAGAVLVAAAMRCRNARRGAALARWLLLGAVACGPSPEPEAPLSERSGRFGSLRDFVWVERGDAAGGGWFADRFEATRSDWTQFAATTKGLAVGADEVPASGNPALPAAGMDLVQARAFARWRLGRLPTAAEWYATMQGDGRSRFPWGSGVDPARANTAELGLGEPTAAGTFEAGRRAGSDGPYDLIGNVSEWTETVPWGWCEPALDVPLSFAACRRRALAAPALAVWQLPGGVLPLGALVAIGGATVPREVMGGDYLGTTGNLSEMVTAGSRRARTGLRVFTTPELLLRELLQLSPPATAGELDLLRRFVARGRHRQLLGAAWQRLPVELRGSTGPVAALLARELAGDGGAARR